ncbi:MAG: hypothetical protein ABI586_05470 [Candidatus Nanopelagicales bacterium]
MSVFRRAARTCVATGIVAGTLYFLVIGMLTLFTGVLTSQVPGLLWLVLFVGAGAGLGLAFGLIAAASLAVVVPLANRSASDKTVRLRVAGALAAGLPILAITVFEQLTGVIGVLSSDVTTVVVIPTAVAACGGAATAPALVGR